MVLASVIHTGVGTTAASILVGRARVSTLRTGQSTTVSVCRTPLEEIIVKLGSAIMIAMDRVSA